MGREFDVIVIGGGHAGCEAAHAAARLGCKTALFTLNPERIGYLSCNPAVGGLAKGQLVKEIDALGGLMGLNTDHSAIQYRRLNTSKGPAVRSSRAQCDKPRYSFEMIKKINKIQNLTVVGQEVSEFVVKNNKITGVRTVSGEEIDAKAVVLTSGTFLQAIMHKGEERDEGGRHGDPSAKSLSNSIRNLGFKLRRLKTGTPPRLHRNSIDFTKLIPQEGDAVPLPFSFYLETSPFPLLPQVPCHLTETNSETHEIIAANVHRSPMFTGAITGVGPRYCPSVEDKVFRFKDKTSHQVFLEPEGLDVDEVYVNGVSTSLPAEVQEKFIRTIKGLEKAVFLRHGYAVEYDALDSRMLSRSLESKDIQGIFFAGQVNGTSGYEEAGAQGLIAGINAAHRAQGKDPFILDRNDAYIGVLIDDLTLKGSDEPYRMFTSRAEYRLLLREDNADLRLSEKAHKLGLLSDSSWNRFLAKKRSIESLDVSLKGFFITPKAETNAIFEREGWNPLKDRVSGNAFLRRPEIGWKELSCLGFDSESSSAEVKEQIEIQTKYQGYIERDLELLNSVRKNERVSLSRLLTYDQVPGLSNEVRGLLMKIRPETLGQASRVPGITPAAVASLYLYLQADTK